VRKNKDGTPAGASHLKFWDRATLEEVRDLDFKDGSIVSLLWHHKINQLFVGRCRSHELLSENRHSVAREGVASACLCALWRCARGLTRVRRRSASGTVHCLYDPRQSEHGIMRAVGKKPAKSDFTNVGINTVGARPPGGASEPPSFPPSPRPPCGAWCRGRAECVARGRRRHPSVPSVGGGAGAQVCCSTWLEVCRILHLQPSLPHLPVCRAVSPVTSFPRAGHIYAPHALPMFKEDKFATKVLLLHLRRPLSAPSLLHLHLHLPSAAAAPRGALAR